MTPPLVLPIAPGSAPGGLVCRLTAHDGTVLSEEVLTEDSAPFTEDIADRQGTIAGEHARVGEPTYLHIFDGDSGQCVRVIVTSTERR